MKHAILIIVLSSITTLAFSQTNLALPLRDSIIIYEDVVKVSDTLSADKLFTMAQTWFANTFKDAKSVLQVNDRQSMKLIGKSSQLLYRAFASTPATYIYYSVSVDIKQGRYRYRLYDFGFEIGNQSEEASRGYSHYLHGEVHKVFPESKKQAFKRYEHDYGFIDLTANSIISSLKRYMKNPNDDNF